MSRRNSAKAREILPDPKFGSLVVAKIINQIMIAGKKGIAENIVYKALEILEEKSGMSAMEALDKVLENTKPVIETKPRRVGGANYQIPVEVRPARAQTLAIRWLVAFAKKRNDRGMENRLGSELVDAFNGTGGAIKRREEVHRMAESNKAFAHFKF